jgi:hypothetical protein
LPSVGDDAAGVKKSWYLLLANGAKRIHPAHGKPFNADLLRRMMEEESIGTNQTTESGTRVACMVLQYHPAHQPVV